MADIPRIQRIIAVLWPSFLMAGLATILFFTAFDPQEFLITTRFAGASRMGTYTVGFFLFWLLTASSCMLTCYFQRPCIFRNSETTSGSHTAHGNSA